MIFIVNAAKKDSVQFNYQKIILLKLIYFDIKQIVIIGRLSFAATFVKDDKKVSCNPQTIMAHKDLSIIDLQSGTSKLFTAYMQMCFMLYFTLGIELKLMGKFKAIEFFVIEGF